MQMRESTQICFGRTSAIGTSNRSGGMGRNELSANAIAASAHLPYRCSENVSHILHQTVAGDWGGYLSDHDVLVLENKITMPPTLLQKPPDD